MSVYVDDANIQASVQNGSRTHTSRWCHLTADSTSELVEFATRLGLRRAWMQRVGKPGEHFDLTANKRRLAVGLGAIEITWREGVEQMRAQAQGVPFDLAALRQGGNPS